MDTRKIFLCVLAVVIGGCIPSLHPLYTQKDVVFEPALIGLWNQDPNITWNFKSCDEPNAYKITYIHKGKDPAVLIGHLAKIDDMLFLDLFPTDPNYAATDLYLAHFVRAHTFMKIEQITPTLKMAWTGDGINKLLDRDPNLLKHEKTANGIVLTASTQELQQFMIKYADANEVFAEPMELHRQE